MGSRMSVQIQNLYANRLQTISAEKTDQLKFALKQKEVESRLIVVVGKERRIFPIDPLSLGIMSNIPGYKDKNPRDMLRLAYCLYKYTLRLAMVTDMKKLRAVPTNEITAIKDNIFTSYDLVLYKLATIKCVMRKLHPVEHWDLIGSVFEHYGLKREDRILYVFLYYNNDIPAFIKMLRSVEDGIPLHANALRDEVSESTSAYKRMRNNASSIAARKLAFIARGNRFDNKDLANDLMMRGIQAYYWVRPFYNKLHAINYACHAMDGWSKCLIKHYTDPSRARIVSSVDGYDNTVVELTGDLAFTDNFNENAMILYLDYMKGNAYAA